MLEPPPLWNVRDSADELVTLADWIRAVASALERAGAAYGQGTAGAIDEARWLVLGSLRLPPDLDSRYEASRLLPHERARLAEQVRRRVIDREPNAYILGEAWLMGLRFRSDPRAIIPRSYLAEVLQDDIFGLNDPPAQILDLCTGSGCLAILAALRWPEAAILASDLSADALALARDNCRDYGLEQRIALRQSDLFEGLSPEERFDLILCNPPYVPEAKISGLPPEFKAEPGLALGAGPDGMSFIRRLLLSVHERLLPDGLLLCEVGFEQAACEALFAHEFPELQPIWLEVTQPQGAVFSLQGRT